MQCRKPQLDAKKKRNINITVDAILGYKKY